MHDEELSSLDICGVYLLLCPGYYTGRVSVDGESRDVDGSDLVLTIQLSSLELPYSTQVLGCGCLPCGLFMMFLSSLPVYFHAFNVQ